MTSIEFFASAEVAASAATEVVRQALLGAGRRTFVATGGRTPGTVYDSLSRLDLGWSGITVTLTDERFVDPSSHDSNARLITTRLLTARAAGADFLALKGSGPTPEADARAVEASLARLLPATVTLLGMGDDGHIGSLFPRDPQLAQRLDPASPQLVVGVDASGEKPFVPRISLTVRALLSTGQIVILITGEGKRAVMEKALSKADVNLPVAAIVRQSATPVRIFWAP